MKVNEKVKAGINGLSIPQVIGKMSHYVSSLTGNTFFTLVPLPDDGAKMVAELQVLDNRVIAGDRTATPLRTNKMAEVKATINTWVAQVNLQAGGNIERLESSGFDFVRAREPRPMPKPVTKLLAKFGTQSGEVVLFWRGASDAKMYKLQYRLKNEPDAQWIDVFGVLKNRYVLSNLGQGIAYEFRVCGVNKAGMGEFSDVASLITQ
jgi:hypothetical protein